MFNFYYSIRIKCNVYLYNVTEGDEERWREGYDKKKTE